LDAKYSKVDETAPFAKKRVDTEQGKTGSAGADGLRTVPASKASRGRE
jgi:hypothetical protein